MTAAFFLLLAYLIGSVSFAILVSKFFKLSDPRSYGSKNPGATNVLRSGKKTAAVLTLLGDSLKGFVVVVAAHFWAYLLVDSGEEFLLIYAAALFVFLGHLFPIFHRFQGGKGVATAAGILFALNPYLGLSVLTVWIVIALVSRYSSLAAITAALLLPLLGVYFLSISALPLCLAMTFLLLFKHRLNIARLIKGEETKIGSKK